MAYRVTPHKSTSYRPNLVMLGRAITEDGADENEYAATLKDRLQSAFTDMRKNLN